MNAGFYHATLADSVVLFADGDTGADHASFIAENLQKCADDGFFVQVLPIREPIKMRLAMAQDETTSKFGKTHKKSSLYITILATNGQFRF